MGREERSEIREPKPGRVDRGSEGDILPDRVGSGSLPRLPDKAKATGEYGLTDMFHNICRLSG